ncbi:methyl-accepting chemotaxis protein [Coprococcus sp. CLA-AA-H212]|uniref:Methyl-accepting chemotaxis protein n=1 Tax=Coprococcus hominis (ex Arizal et al. 2022) TaxID=2881262 RepID=A0ABS8FMQ9_9FIRM|nr:cache domain-containing protein [Lachnospiraceae bacterium]MCC2218447.1 methyl-accepting chemotaxis protein [Coprococcus hominis (ex Arizal et al. 2022)]
MKIFRNLKLQYKMLILAIIPVLIMGIVAILISNTVVKNKLLDDAKQKLKATSNAVLAAYDQNAGDYFVNATGDVWKGAYNVSLSTPFIDDIAAKTGIEVTFFYNDTRLVTSLKDADGKRILGSKAGDFLVENVLQDGNEVFTNRVLVDGTFYFGYYVPVHQNNSDEIIGMVFAGMPVKEIYASLNLITMIFTVAILVILVIAVIGCLLVSRGIAKSIRNSMDVVKQISEGNLNVEIEQSMLDRKDEAGALSCNTQTLIDNLSAMIGKISNNTMTLNASSEEMNAAAGQAGNAVGNINDDLHNMLTGAVEQTGNAQNIKNSIHNMNIHLEKTLGEVDHLSDETKAMLDARNDVDKSLNQLDASNQDVMTEVENIQKQTQQNNESVEKIIAAVSYISDIADQTNLLSLNASIEAARAGETGKGFAVVAEEIGKLANQSNEASTEISELVNLLSYNSSQTMDIMDSVQDAMNDQTKKLVETANIFKQLQEHVSHVADGVDVIRDATVQLGKETDEIGKDIKNLSDIAQRNEDTVKGTISFSDEVLGTVNSVTEMSTEVSSSANDMAGVVSHFRM